MLKFAIQSGVTGGIVPVAGTFEQFVRALRSEVETEHACNLADPSDIKTVKEGMVAFVPAHFDAGADRCAANVRGSGIIGLDIDGCPPDAWAGAVARLHAGSVAAVAHTSPTDGLTPGVRKGRIFVATDREAEPGEIWPLRCALAEALGVREWLDPQTKNADRIFFAGRLAGTPARDFVVTGAEPVPATGLLARYPHAAPPVSAPPPATNSSGATPFIWPAGEAHEHVMVSPLVALLAPTYAAGGRHEKVRALGAVLAQAGWTDAGIRNVVGQLPSDKVPARIEQALDAARLARAGERVHQIGTLTRVFGDRLARHVTELAEQPDFANMRAAAAAPPAVATADAWGAIERIDDLEEEIPPVPWLVENLVIAPGAPTIIAGYGGLGKSMFAQLLVVCVATGQRMLETMAVRTGRVLHLDYEQGRRLTRTRYKRLAAPLGLPKGALRDALEIVHAPAVNLLTPGVADVLCKRLEGVSMCVIDSLRAATPGLDENDSRIREPLDMLLRVSEKTDCTFLVIHHARKPTKDSHGGNYEMRGNSAINDAAQTVIMLEPPPKVDDAPAFVGFNVTAGKVRDGKPFDPIGISVEDPDIEGYKFKGLDLVVVDVAKRAAAIQELQMSGHAAEVLALVQGAPGGFFADGISELCNMAACGRNPARRAVSELKRRGILKEQPHNGRKAIFVSADYKGPAK